MPLLTKSRFKIAHDCPTKLYYHNHPEIYANKAIADPFLQALADGGFQVGALAKLYYRSQHEITTRDKVEALRQTDEHMNNDEVTIHEACFGYDDKFFIKADIVVKQGPVLNLIEVKAKSFRSTDPNEFTNKKGDISSSWKEYIYDLAFQYWVVKKAYPDLAVRPFLLLADKDKKATVDGLHQMFRIKRAEVKVPAGEAEPDYRSNMPEVIVNVQDRADLGDHILSPQDMSEIIRNILDQEHFESTGMSFEAYLYSLANLCVNDTKQYRSIGKACKNCEFVKDPGKPELRSGMDECWSRVIEGYEEGDNTRQKFFQVWNRRDDLVYGKYFLDQLELSDIDRKNEINPAQELLAMSSKGRQWLQVKLVKEDATQPVILKESLKQKIATFKYPFNFIDFETLAAALPFNRGMRPYEMIAFQFSHHIMHEDGTVEHANEWINKEPGFFPNFEFVRKLKAALEKNEGTVFRFATHENTVLNKIREQLAASDESDKEELIRFIRTITNQGDGKSKIHIGERDMVDLCDLVKKYYLHPMMKGSNSIKKVLPAVLNSSQYLQEKYSQPIYGSSKMKSLNYDGKVWIVKKEGIIADPYKLLDPIFDRNTDETLEDALEGGGETDNKIVGDGGAAMMAYAEMQYADLDQTTRQQRINSLLKYCELDTLAMVMIMEEFVHV